MIQKSSTKILSTSVGDISLSFLSSSGQLEQSADTSLLSDSQLQLLDYSAQEIRLATNALILAVKKEVDSEEGKLTRSPSKSKRMLPLSPQRSNSFRGSPSKQGRVKRMAALVDIAASQNS